MMRRMPTLTRRHLLHSSLSLPLWTLGTAEASSTAQALAALRDGGVVLALRHALAPGTFDPPEFTLGNCSTQRNLNDEGRAQAQRIGRWFQQQGLKPTQVRSSPWCRCMDTATGAFGTTQTQAWAALGSPYGRSEQSNEESQAQLRAAMAAVLPGRFEVWVTHAFVQQALAGQSTGSGEGLVLRTTRAGPGPGAGVQVLARWALA